MTLDRTADGHRKFAGVPLAEQVEIDAKQAADSADLAEMKSLYQKQLKNLRDVQKLMDVLVEHYSGTTKHPRMESDSAINAMQAVAMSAIDLAKAVTSHNGKK